MQERIKEFADRTAPGAMLLRGAWGVGKTHACLNALKSNDEKNQKPFSYVSLYGVTSLDDIYTRLVAGWTNKITSKLPDSFKNIVPAKKWGWISRWVERDGVRLAGLFLGNKFGATTAAAASLLVRNSLIVIDDLERKDEKLTIPTALGVVSHLVEAQECRVIFITNDEEMKNDKGVFDTHTEKVFDIEIPFTPTVEENAEIFAGEFKEFLLPPLKSLGVSNLRVIRRTYEALQIIKKHLPSDCPLAEAAILKNTAILGILHYGFRGKIDINSLQSAGGLAIAKMMGRAQEPATEEAELTSKADFENGPLDNYIREIVFTGGTAWRELAAATRDYQVHFDALNINATFNTFLQSIFENYQVSSEEAASRLTAMCEQYTDTLKPDSLAWAAHVLVQLGLPDRKCEWLNKWAAANMKRLPDSDLHRVLEGIDVPVKELLPFYKAESERRRPPLTIQDVLKRCVLQQRVYDDEIERVSQLALDEYIDWLKTSKSDDIRDILRHVFSHFYGREGAEGVVAKKALSAVDSLAEHSPLGALRAQSYKRALPTKLKN